MILDITIPNYFVLWLTLLHSNMLGVLGGLFFVKRDEIRYEALGLEGQASHSEGLCGAQPDTLQLQL